MDENQMAGQTPTPPAVADHPEAAHEHHEQRAGAATPQAAAAPAAPGTKKAITPNRLVAQVGTQMSALQQAETIKQLQGQVKQLESQSKDAGKVFLATTTTLITSAFALVAALAWNEAIQNLFRLVFSSGNTTSGLGATGDTGGSSVGLVISSFSYAVVVTIIVVAIIYYLTRLNTRIGGRSLIGEAPKAGKEG